MIDACGGVSNQQKETRSVHSNPKWSLLLLITGDHNFRVLAGNNGNTTPNAGAFEFDHNDGLLLMVLERARARSHNFSRPFVAAGASSSLNAIHPSSNPSSRHYSFIFILLFLARALTIKSILLIAASQRQQTAAATRSKSSRRKRLAVQQPVFARGASRAQLCAAPAPPIMIMNHGDEQQQQQQRRTMGGRNVIWPTSRIGNCLFSHQQQPIGHSMRVLLLQQQQKQKQLSFLALLALPAVLISAVVDTWPKQPTDGRRRRIYTYGPAKKLILQCESSSQRFANLRI
ncbi:hypothetical protein GPALN_012389 [Globodera pallida]|nr:hypothetical protein GPALN_012389 [Globodera pallida]